MPLLAMTPRRMAVVHGLGQWLGEAAIGIIPWVVYEMVHRYADLPLIAACPKQPGSSTPLNDCTRIADSASQEICILAVVISGLAVLSVVPLGEQRKRPITVWTRLLVLFAVVALIFGSLFYGLFTAHLDRGADAITYYFLAIALLSSLCLSIEKNVLSE
jgi:hypothetical protein